MSALRVELFYDEEASNWHYRVPALHINGGGTESRADAERQCLSAIAFALGSAAGSSCRSGPVGWRPAGTGSGLTAATGIRGVTAITVLLPRRAGRPAWAR